MSNKHDANVRKSTLVNFQIGLIVSLLFTYLMFEVYTAIPVVQLPTAVTVEEPPVEWDENYKIYKESKPKQAVVKRSKPVVDPQKFEVIKDDEVVESMKEEFKNDLNESDPITSDDILDVPIDEPEEKFPFVKVEFVPIFPGCEMLETNDERASCFSDKIKRIVSRKFNTGLGDQLGLKGLQRIYVQFDVYKDGTIQNVKARAPHPSLEREAKRVVAKFPKMTPGKQRDRAVTVKYQLPIVFKIQE
ncbi:energy transducer TonB [Aquimarina sediminis]|uniref:energy transducer TonB n=1 Tax=Aquimarina sediminis TaxID=2070536 RepID=UPI0013E8A213|nr:energy transducer TonB [Aquimarina sediminis]